MKKLFNLWRIAILPLAVLAVSPAFNSCSPDDELEIKVTGVSIDNPVNAMVIGASVKLEATVLPEDALHKDVAWTSDDESILTVDEHGIVRALAEGTATITVTTDDGGFTDTCEIIVTEDVIAVTRVELDREAIEIYDNTNDKLIATVYPIDATNQKVTWSSDDDTIATVDQEGNVEGVSEGEAVITVTTEDGEHTAICEVTVLSSAIPVEDITVNPVSMGLKINQSQTISFEIFPGDATNQDVTWSSDTPSVADVGENGLVTAASIGTAIITVATDDGGFTATCEVKVTEIEVIVAGMAGDTRSPRGYVWNNGVGTVLGDGASNSIAVAVTYEGDNVYVLGTNGSPTQPAYWKDGEMTQLKDSPNATVKDIFVKDGDVYAAWHERIGFYMFPMTWADGTVTQLSENGSVEVNALWVDGTDIYAVGFDNMPYKDSELTIATVWKNGAFDRYLTDGGDMYSTSVAKDIYIDGSDIYIAGNESMPYTGNLNGRIWKNNELLYSYANDKSMEILSLMVYNGDVYAAGWETGDGGGPVGIVFKNDQKLYTLGANTQVNAIYIYDGDVYFTGYATASWTNTAQVWKNGEVLYTLKADDANMATNGTSIIVK